MLRRGLTKHTLSLARGLATKTGKQALPVASKAPPLQPPPKPPKDNTWILHPALPIDVRLLGLGLLGASLAAYQLRPAAKTADTRRPSDELLRDAAEAPPAKADASEDVVDEAEEEQAVGEQPTTTAEAHAPPAHTDPPEEPTTTTDDDDAPVYVDGSKVMAVIEEALRPPEKITPPADHVVDVVESIEAEAAAQPPVHQLATLDDSLAAAEEDVARPPPSFPASPAPPRVTASWLIGKSTRDGDADWAAYAVRLKQAEADAAAVQELVDKVHASARAEVEQATAIATKALAAAGRLREAYAAELQRQAHALDMQHAAELQLQADKLAVEHQAALRETMEQHAQQVDDVREELNALSAAFSRRSEERRSSHSAHKLALASMALDAALETGAAFDDVLQALHAAAGDDAVAACVLDSVASTGAAQRGVPTSLQLLQQFRGAKRRLQELLLVPAGALGPATFAAAKVAGWLRVDAGDDVLSRAEALISSGKLLEAAGLIEKEAAGTAAAGEVGRVCSALRTRSIVQQASACLGARARALTVSLV